MKSDRHRQLGFACDPAGAIVLAGDLVQVRCETCGTPVEDGFIVARTFRTGAISIFDRSARQRHVRMHQFTLTKLGGVGSMKSHAIIHIAKKDLRLDDEAYRAMLERVTGKTSIAAMDEAERGRVIVEMKRMGFQVRSTAKPKRKPSEKAYVRLIFALWRSIGEAGGLEDRSVAALKAFVERRTGVADPEWLTYAQADPLIRALKAMEARGGASDAGA